jgi:hypothetical protein
MRSCATSSTAERMQRPMPGIERVPLLVAVYESREFASRPFGHRVKDQLFRQTGKPDLVAYLLDECIEMREVVVHEVEHRLLIGFQCRFEADDGASAGDISGSPAKELRHYDMLVRQRTDIRNGKKRGGRIEPVHADTRNPSRRNKPRQVVSKVGKKPAVIGRIGHSVPDQLGVDAGVKECRIQEDLRSGARGCGPDENKCNDATKLVGRSRCYEARRSVDRRDHASLLQIPHDVCDSDELQQSVSRGICKLQRLVPPFKMRFESVDAFKTKRYMSPGVNARWDAVEQGEVGRRVRLETYGIAVRRVIRSKEASGNHMKWHGLLHSVISSVD